MPSAAHAHERTAPSPHAGRSSERERRIVEHVPLVRQIALRMSRRFPSHLELDELASIGMVGLIEAADRFDASRGVPFAAFAELRVRGAIVDAMRGSDWVPRAVRQKNTLLDATRSRLRQRLGRDPDRTEMATALEVTPEAYDNLTTAAAVRRLVSLDAPLDADGGQTLAEVVSDESDTADDRWMRVERSEVLSAAIGRLPENQRVVITLYYERGLKFTEIGQMMGVCESRVCQLRGQAVNHIRKHVRAAMAG